MRKISEEERQRDLGCETATKRNQVPFLYSLSPLNWWYVSCCLVFGITKVKLTGLYNAMAVYLVSFVFRIFTDFF